MPPEIPPDVRLFLDGYPRQDNDTNLDRNLRFYSNELRCKPDNLLIDGLHDEWVNLSLTPIHLIYHADGKETMRHWSTTMALFSGCR